ncbi:hypothetical protein I4U23_000568 [Adineta vaga]|nr:hypothetical protein I4U23_000568 [Adineta vaga]
MDHRKVAPMEMYSVVRHQMEFYKSVLCYLRFDIPAFSLSQWQTRIEQAIRLTIDAQPRLRLQVDISRAHPYYIVLPMNVFNTLPIQIIERTNNDNDEEKEFLETVLTDETNRGFKFTPNLPLWRIVLIVSSGGNILDFIFTYSHALGDGISGMSFFTSIVRCLTEKSISTFPLDKDQPANELLPSKLPSLSSLIPKIIENLILPACLKPYFFPKTYWAGNIHLTGDESNQTRLVSFQLPDSSLDLLHKKCRLKQITIHTALLASFLLSVADIFGKKDMEFYCTSAVDTRRFCQPIVSKEQIGVFVSAAPSHHYIPHCEHLLELFWPLACQIKEQINTGIENEIIQLVQSLKYVSDWNTMLINHRKTLPNGYQNSVEISNLLRWTFDTNDQPWKIVHGGFIQSANLIGGPFALSVVTVNDILEVNITFQEHTFESIEQVKSIRNRMKMFLLDAISL